MTTSSLSLSLSLPHQRLSLNTSLRCKVWSQWRDHYTAPLPRVKEKKKRSAVAHIARRRGRRVRGERAQRRRRVGAVLGPGLGGGGDGATGGQRRDERAQRRNARARVATLGPPRPKGHSRSQHPATPDAPHECERGDAEAGGIFGPSPHSSGLFVTPQSPSPPISQSLTSPKLSVTNSSISPSAPRPPISPQTGLL